MNPKDLPLGRPNESIQRQRDDVPWIWEGVIALGAVTLLSAPEKTGKTTLLSLLADRRRAGGQLLGRTVWPGKTLVCTEESDRLWSLRQPPLNFGPDVTFRWQGRYVPNNTEWQFFLDQLAERCLKDEEIGAYDLLVIDTAIRFLPLAQRNKNELQRVLAQLAEAARLPLGILLINQSRNVHRPLAAFADIVIEIAIPRASAGSSQATRRRIFTGVGRYPDTLQRADAELNAEGTDYLLLPDTPAPHPPILTVLQKLLAESPTPLTHHDLLARWPAPAPHPDSLWRTLSTAVEHGMFNVTGRGTRTEPYQFTLASPAI